jgi:hypothetical protein
MISASARASLSICFVSLLVLSGCSRRPKNVAPVTGKVTLGGQPLAGAMITFAPTTPGSSSIAKTNENGEYTLQYAHGIQGALIGDHVVSITTRQEGDPGAKPPVPDVPEKVPYVYRSGAQQLKATVNAGPNTIDFDLKPGPAEPPQPKGKRRGR